MKQSSIFRFSSNFDSIKMSGDSCHVHSQWPHHWTMAPRSQFSGAPNSAFRHGGGLRRWHQRGTPAGCGQGGECAGRWKEAAKVAMVWGALGWESEKSPEQLPMGTWKNPWGLDGFLELAGFLLASMLNLMTILYGDILGSTSSRRYIAHGTCVGETPPMAMTF